MIWGQTKPPLGVKINHSHPLSKGLVGCWVFNEGGGNKIYDLSGNGININLSNFEYPPTQLSGWNSSINTKCLRFDNSNDFGLSGTSPVLKINGTMELSVNLFVKINGLPTSSLGSILISISEGFSNTRDKGIVLKNSGYAYFWVYPGGAKNAEDNTTYLYDGKIHMITGTFKDKYAKIFVDGIYKNGIDANSSYNEINPTVLFGGPLPYTSPNADYIQASYYKRALSDHEILQLYKEPFAMFND